MSSHKNLYVQTPLIEETRPVFPGKKLSYKMEAFQPCGCFKLRGIELACRKALANGAKRVAERTFENVQNHRILPHLVIEAIAYLG